MTKSGGAKNEGLAGALVGVQLVNGDKYIGKFVKSNVDFIWLRVKDYAKPIDIPKITISRMLFLLPEEQDGE